MYAPLEKEKKGRYYEMIVDRIKSMIINGQLKCGDKLPSERELADKFQVSRVPIREALKILEYLGVLDAQSDGMYIKNVGVNDLLNKVDFAFDATSDMILNLLEVRISLEGTAAYYAALRHTDEDIQLIRESLETMRKLKQANLHNDEHILAMRQQSHKFHICMVNAAKNPVLISVYEKLYELLEISRQLTINISGISYDSILAHEAIFHRIVERDCDGARAFMVEHLNATCDRIRNAITV